MAALIRNVVLNPLVTGPLLILFTVGPQQVREPILDSLKSYSYYRPVERGVLALKWLFGLGLAGSVHGFLSELGQNNFRLRSEKHRYDWPNEIAVVTGAASGFGRLISEGLAAKGIRVMALDLHDSLPADMPPNEKINYYKCDITSAEAVNAVADAIRSDYGNPSILVNNAGIAFDTSIMATSPEKLRRIFDVNTLSHYFTVQALLPSMVKQRKGHIVTMASMASFLSGPVS